MNIQVSIQTLSAGDDSQWSIHRAAEHLPKKMTKVAITSKKHYVDFEKD